MERIEYIGIYRHKEQFDLALIRPQSDHVFRKARREGQYQVHIGIDLFLKESGNRPEDFALH